MLIEVVSTPLRNPATVAGMRAAAARWRSCHSPAAITATPTPIWSGSRESAASIAAPSASPGSAGRISGGRRDQRASWRSSRTSTLSAAPSASSTVTASAGSITANNAGESTSAKPKPVADCTAAPTRAATAARTISRL